MRRLPDHASPSAGVRVLVFGVVLLGLLTLGAGQARATHVSCGATLVASTTLDSDLIDCPADGLIVGADNITINLNGHTIDGPGTDDSRWDGVDNGAGHDGVTVKDGTIRDFGGDGVYIDNAGTENRLEKLVLTDNGIGVEVIGSENNSIKETSITDNHLFGIIVGESALTRIQKSTIAQNQADGILVRASTDGLIEKNVIDAGAFGTGIQVLGGARTEIIENAISTTELSGTGVFFISDDGLIAKNEIHGFTETAVFISGGISQGDRTRVEKNSLHDNGLGLLIRGNPFFCCLSGIVASKNEIFSNEVVGIGVQDVANALVEHNLVHDNGVGIGVRNSSGVTDATGTLIVGNRSDNNVEDGIQVLVPATTITSNSASFNGDFGIEAVAGVIDGGGNRATGNGNPAQCLNVACSTGGGG
jgi:nitrous oxidase accessory protein NosD